MYEDILINGVWQRRYHNVLRDSIDPLYYLTGDTAGEGVVLQNIAALLKKWFGR